MIDCACLFQSNNDEELSEAELPDEDSEDALSRLPVEDVGDPEVLAKLKQQVCAHNHHDVFRSFDLFGSCVNDLSIL